MLQKAIVLLFVAFSLISCQFTETMVLNEDRSGRMSIEIDMGELMAFGGIMDDSVTTKLDMVDYMKNPDVLDLIIELEK